MSMLAAFGAGAARGVEDSWENTREENKAAAEEAFKMRLLQKSFDNAKQLRADVETEAVGKLNDPNSSYSITREHAKEDKLAAKKGEGKANYKKFNIYGKEATAWFDDKGNLVDNKFNRAPTVSVDEAKQYLLASPEGEDMEEDEIGIRAKAMSESSSAWAHVNSASKRGGGMLPKTEEPDEGTPMADRVSSDWGRAKDDVSSIGSKIAGVFGGNAPTQTEIAIKLGDKLRSEGFLGMSNRNTKDVGQGELDTFLQRVENARKAGVDEDGRDELNNIIKAINLRFKLNVNPL